MKRTVLLIVFSALLFSLGLFELFTSGQVFVEGVVGYPTSFYPLDFSENEIDETVSSLLFRSLIKVNKEGDLENDLAQSVEVREDGKIYAVSLKQNIYWNDSNPITKEDVVFTFSNHPDFKDVKVEISGEEVIFTLQKPFAPFMHTLTFPVVPAHLADRQDRLAPSGSGPFFVSGVKRNGFVKEVTLKTGSDLYRIKTIIFKFYETEQGLKQAVRLGVVDGAVLSRFGHESFTDFESPIYGRYFALFINQKSGNELLRSDDFRKDLAASTPVDEVIDKVLEGEGTAVLGPLSFSWAYDAGVELPTFNKDLEAKYSGKITIKVPDIPVHLETAGLVKNAWEKLGVEVAIEPIALSNVEEEIRVRKNFEVVLLGQQVGRDPDRYVQWHSTQVDPPGLNFTSFEDPRTDKALEQGRQVLDKQERREHYSNFQELFVQNLPAIFLYHPLLSYHVKKDVLNVELGVIHEPKDRFLGFERWGVD